MVTHDTIVDVTQQLKGAAALGGTDVPTLKGWLLCHKRVRKTLSKAVANLTE